jgi:hypothetical protein
VLIISLVVATLAVARLTRLLTEDRLTAAWRRWAVRKWGTDSLQAYFVHCPWCMSMWIAPPLMVLATLVPSIWVIAVLSIPAASYVTGFLASRE